MPEDLGHDQTADNLAGWSPEARSEALKRARAAHGYSIEDMALTTGLTETEISALEAGEIPNPDYLERLMKSLAITK